MAEPKTQVNDASVDAFLDGACAGQSREDCRVIAEMMSDATGEPPRMWGTNIVGFGTYTYRYASGRTGDWPLAGFSPRKQALSLYIMSGFDEYEGLLARLGKFTTGKACLYVKRLADVDVEVLRDLVNASVAHMRASHPG
ncbi:MAG: DUF1801 domain-containing protein [Chloroflexota bacterium]